MIYFKKPNFVFKLNKNVIQFIFSFKRPVYCFGLKNKINENQYLGFYDFDNVEFSKVMYFIEYLYDLNDRIYGLSVLQSSENHYHLILWKIMTYFEYLNTLFEALKYGMDKGYLQIFLNREFSVLRISPKGPRKMPRLILYLRGNHDKEFINLLYNANKQLLVYSTFNY